MGARKPLRIVGWVVTVLLGIIAVLGVAIVLFTSTDWGREQIRRVAVSQLENMINGNVSIGRITGNLLTGMVVNDFAITDSAGQPFIAADSVEADYQLMALLKKRVWLDDVRVVRPVVVLNKPPGGEWNYQRIFVHDTTPSTSQGPGWGDWIKITDATVVDGHLTVLSPWHPSDRLETAAARDSAIQDVLSGGSRLVVERVPNGFQKRVELRSVTAQFPLLRLADPEFENRLARVSALEMTALPFHPPAARVTAMQGDFSFSNDSVWWSGVQARMPDSNVSGDGRYVFDSGDMTLDLHGAPAALADLRWVFPRLPSEGQGTLDFLMNWEGGVEDYVVTDADVHVGDARAVGDFAIAIADTFTIHDTDLTVENVGTRLLEQLINGFDSPRRGTITGHAVVSGGRRALQVNGDIAFNDQVSGTSRVAAVGQVGFGNGVSAKNLRLRLHPVRLELALQGDASVPVSGMVTGTAVVNGNSQSQLNVRGDLQHVDRGTLSRITGTAAVKMDDPLWMNVDVRAHPVSLAEVGRFAPALELRGGASGPIHITGTLQNAKISADLELPLGGALVADGTLDLSGAEKGYTLAAAMRVVNLNAVSEKAPVTSLTAKLAGQGRGFDPATMQAAFALDAGTSSWDSVGVDTASVRVAIADGMLTVQRAELAGSHTVANVSGNFGLTNERTGELTYTVAVDSLGAFNRWLPRSAEDTGVVAPRPGRVARAMRVARADSARIARETEVERAVTGAPAPTLKAAVPQSLARDTLQGSLYAAGIVRGNIQNFYLRGRAALEDVVARGNSARRLRSEYAWVNRGSNAWTIAIGVQGDTVSTAGFAFDSVDARFAYSRPESGGRVELVVRQGGDRDYALQGDYIWRPNQRELRLADLTLRFDTTRWVLTQPAVVEWEDRGIDVEQLELRNGRNGRIYANGLLPTEGTANFALQVDNFEISHLVDLLQSDITMTGLVSLSGRMDGTLASPELRGAFGVVEGIYNGTPVPDLHGTFAYDDQLLTSHVDALRDGGAPMTVVDAKLPINLALQGVSGTRLLDRPLAVDVVADSLPLELIPQFTDVVSNVHGLAAGKVAMRGTFDRPSLVGSLLLARGQVTITELGATFLNVAGSVRMLNDSIHIDSLVGQNKGDIRLRGSLGVGSWREPSFNLYLVARNALVMDNELATLQANAGLALTGPFNNAYLSGQVTITDGVIRIPESSRKSVIGADNPALFNVADTAIVTQTELLQQPSPLMANLRTEVAIEVNRDTWVRGRDANVEIYTDYPVFVRRTGGVLALTGAIVTERGDYTFLSKHFEIKRGSAIFVGGAELDPLLQATGEYEVQLPNQPALTISVLIGGTLHAPKLSLESDAQPPRSQSELLSYLAFGRSTTSLTAGSGALLGTASTPTGLVGFGAQLAVRRLAGVAMGVAIDELESEAGNALGTDVLNITPADVPTEVTQGHGIANFLLETRIEAGKYINSRTFVGVQTQGLIPGAVIQYRTSKGWRYEMSLAPRLILKEPTLSGQPYFATQAFGAFIIREWRF